MQIKKITALTLAASLCGCAQIVWKKDGATIHEFERDKAQCQYEANLATASYSNGQTARSYSGAIGQGIGEGIAIGLKQAELIRQCMLIKGYTPMTAPPNEESAAQPEPTTAPTSAAATASEAAHTSYTNEIKCRTNAECFPKLCRSMPFGGTECK